MYVDNLQCSLSGILQFDVIVTSNMFGDIYDVCHDFGFDRPLPSASLGEQFRNV